MSIISTLNKKLLKQSFGDDQNESVALAEGQQLAYAYSLIENSIAVLSDLKADKSYIYNGGVAEKLGIAERNSTGSINSIWEETIFKRIHPDDLMEKHLLELHFFHLLKTLPIKERSDYHTASRIRISDNSGKYVMIHHRMFYVCNCSSGSLWLALCLYNFPYDKSIHEMSNGVIINSATGEIIQPDRKKHESILSSREKEVLQLIERGKTSEEIADLLFISKYTVSRHRQNILEKLRVKNSIEAIRIAKYAFVID